MKAVNKILSLGHKKEETAPLTRKCPYCYGEIDIKATKCMHCASDVSDSAQGYVMIENGMYADFIFTI